MSDGIFEAFARAGEVGQGLDRLLEALTAAFLPLKMEFADNEDDRGLWWTPRSYTAHLRLRSLSAARRDDAHLAVRFDLCRADAAPSDWPWARSALVVVAYAIGYDCGWRGEQLAVGGDGRLAYEATATLARAAGDRLLIAKAPPAGRWADAEWAFATPLQGLEGEGALAREVAAPVTALLLLGAAPDQAFAATRAVAWSKSV